MSNNNESRRHLAKMFHKKFEAIPDEKWCLWEFHNGHGAYCALGHTMKPHILSDTPDTPALRSLFPQTHSWVGDINNGWDDRYQQPTPKARILAALEDVIRQ